MLFRYKKIIDKELELYSGNLPSLAIYDPIKYIIGLGGKRFRSSLTLLASDLFCGKPLLSVNEAVAIELFHNFTLIHDDIMDEAPIRRNHQSVHKKWNINDAILSGDLLYALVNKLLSTSSSQSPEIHKLFQQTAIEVCEGQSLDMEFENKNDISLAEYINMIQLKTSVLVACALKIGALIGGADLNNANLLYNFGLNLGTAFQIHDDILDVYPNKDSFGKQIGGDIIEKKKTILLIELLRKSSSEDQKMILKTLEDKEMKSNLKVTKIKEYYKKYNVLDLAVNSKNEYLEKAIECANQIDISENKKNLVREFSVALMDRKI
jgi:geranylgeranyl diphosphate synthase, type II